MYRYRIYVAGCSKDQLLHRCLERGIEGLTIYEAIGVWKTKQENSFVVEILEHHCKTLQMIDITKYFKTIWKQDCVLLTVDKTEVFKC
jgi:hypothetical protein